MVAIAGITTPGVYIQEVPSGSRPIDQVGSSTVGFVGEAPDPGAQENVAVFVENFGSFARRFAAESTRATHLALAVRGFFENGGRRCCVVNVGKGPLTGGRFGQRQGLEVLEEVDEVAIVCIPGYTDVASYDAAISHCTRLKDRVAILDAPERVPSLEDLTVPATVAIPAGRSAVADDDGEESPPARAPMTPAPKGTRPPTSDDGYAAFYFPWVVMNHPFPPTKPGVASSLVTAPPSGHIAGIYARSDATRGVHKAPANEVVASALALTYQVTAAEQGPLNENGVNVIRMIGGAPRVWGARTLALASSPWRYINVRRTFAMIEESIIRGTSWVVFEPNDEMLWSKLRREIGSFLHLVHRSGALVGQTPEEAYFVKCDAENNPPELVDRGFVIVEIGIAVVKPAEFIIFRIGQHAAGVEQAEVGHGN